MDSTFYVPSLTFLYSARTSKLFSKNAQNSRGNQIYFLQFSIFVLILTLASRRTTVLARCYLANTIRVRVSRALETQESRDKVIEPAG